MTPAPEVLTAAEGLTAMLFPGGGVRAFNLAVTFVVLRDLSAFVLALAASSCC